MEQAATIDKPEGFSENFSKILAECIARGIVEQSIRNIHNREKINDENKGLDISREGGYNRFMDR